MNLRTIAHNNRTEYLQTVKNLVEIETPTDDKHANDGLADFIASLLQREGWRTERIKQIQVGDQLIAQKSGQGNVSSLLLCHMDTVWPIGTLRDMPIKVDNDNFFGPGVLDMKSGIATAVHAMRLIEKSMLNLKGPVTLLITSDEEKGSLYSRSLIEKLGKEHTRVLVLEPGCDDGSLKIGRKCTGSYRINFNGISAHAGNNPRDGASALRELAHYLFFAESMTDYDKGITVNCTVAQGGSAPNVIAEEAWADLNLRTIEYQDALLVDRELKSYKPEDPRIKVELQGGVTRPPFKFNKLNKQLFAEFKEAMAAIGINLEGAFVGGGSDGNFTSALQVPTIDGLGAVGSGAHARNEHINISKSLDRLALMIAALITP